MWYWWPSYFLSNVYHCDPSDLADHCDHGYYDHNDYYETDDYYDVSWVHDYDDHYEPDKHDDLSWTHDYDDQYEPEDYDDHCDLDEHSVSFAHDHEYNVLCT